MSGERYRGLSDVRRRNRRNIRSLLYRRAPVTRTELAEELGLTLPTVTTSVAGMLEEGLLVEQPAPSGGGRRPNLLRFNPSAGYALGVELGPYETAVGLYDLTGEPLVRRIYPAASDGYDEMIETLAGQLAELAAIAPVPVLGAGIGLPGFVSREQGVVRASRTGWTGKPVAGDLSKRLGFPVLIDNNVRMRAAGQELFCGGGLPDLFAYFFVSKGIACPLIIRNELLSGSTSGAGEIGHMVIQPDGPICPTCGRRGCLEGVTGETAILRDCEQLLQFGRAAVLREIAGENPPDMKMVLQAQEAGDPDVREVMDRAVGYLGLALAGVVNLISPGQVLVDGYLFRLPENRETLLREAQRHFYGLNAQEVAIRFLPFDHYGGARGAAAAVIERFCIQGDD